MKNYLKIQIVIMFNCLLVSVVYAQYPKVERVGKPQDLKPDPYVETPEIGKTYLGIAGRPILFFDQKIDWDIKYPTDRFYAYYTKISETHVQFRFSGGHGLYYIDITARQTDSGIKYEIAASIPKKLKPPRDFMERASASTVVQKNKAFILELKAPYDRGIRPYELDDDIQIDDPEKLNVYERFEARESYFTIKIEMSKPDG